MRKRLYRRISVKKISQEILKNSAIEKGDVGTTVGLDIAKDEIVCVVRWPDSSFERPWSVKNPSEIHLLIELLDVLRDVCGSLVIGLESTGTYGEAVRYAMTQAGFEVDRVSGKGVSDYKEIFDGVPSQHDGKDAAIISELTSMGKGTAWPYTEDTEFDQQLRHQIKRREAFHSEMKSWAGKLEGMLAKHWPELCKLLKSSSKTLLMICAHYAGPKDLLADPDVEQRLRQWGRTFLTASKIKLVIESARNTTGIPLTKVDKKWLQEIATEILIRRKKIGQCDKALNALTKPNEVFQKYKKQVGIPTLCTIWEAVGDPRQYESAGAFIKAMGLNLKEISSGKRKGELGISKRGKGYVRRMVFMWAFRTIQRSELRTWYKLFQKVGRATSKTNEYRKMKALVALMRKLCKSLWYVMKHDLAFDYAKIFPGEPLEKRKRIRRRPVSLA